MNGTLSTVDRQEVTAVIVDAHVHIHDCFDLVGFLNSAARNFSSAAIAEGMADDYVAVLCLTETSSADRFGQLRKLAESNSNGSALDGSAWRICTTDEPVSVTVEHRELGRICIVAGKQIVVAERLEVLALGCGEKWQDGMPASEVIDGVTLSGACAVLPWGFGKWMGRRGKIVRSLIEKHHGRRFFVGDNSGRPIFFSEPREFGFARNLGLKVLPGTDPLPFASEAHRAGSFGFHMVGAVGQQTPWSDLSRCLVEPGFSIQRFGRLETPMRFVKNQVAMQYFMRRGGARS